MKQTMSRARLTSEVDALNKRIDVQSRSIRRLMASFGVISAYLRVTNQLFALGDFEEGKIYPISPLIQFNYYNDAADVGEILVGDETTPRRQVSFGNQDWGI